MWLGYVDKDKRRQKDFQDDGRFHADCVIAYPPVAASDALIHITLHGSQPPIGVGCRLKRLQAAMLPQYGSYVHRGGAVNGVGERVEQAEKERVAHEGPAMRRTHGLDIGHIVCKGVFVMFVFSEIINELDRQLADRHMEYCVRVPMFGSGVACVSTAIDRRPLVVRPGHGCVVASRDGESRPFALADGLEESVRPLARLVENMFEGVR